jgi:hypothetical protein
LRQRTGPLTGDSRHQHPGGKAAVEQDGQADVTGRLAPLAEHLHHHGTCHTDADGDRYRRPAGEQRQADAGDGDVTQAVTEQAQPPLNDVGPDGRGDQPGEQRGQQSPDHEGIAQQLGHRSIAPSNQPDSGSSG